MLTIIQWFPLLRGESFMIVNWEFQSSGLRRFFKEGFSELIHNNKLNEQQINQMNRNLRCSLTLIAPFEKPHILSVKMDEMDACVTWHDRLTAELPVHWCMMGEWVEGVGEMVSVATAAADRNRLLQRLQLHERQAGRCHVWGGACTGHFWGHFLFQTERQGL